MVLEAEPYESQKYAKGKAPATVEELTTEFADQRLNMWYPPLEPLKALADAKPPPPEKPLPDLIVYTLDPSAPPGTPAVVATRLAEIRGERERISDMWKKEGKTKAWIPNTSEARKMKLQAKLQNRLDLKHTEVVRKFVDTTKRVIEMPADTVAATPLENFV